MVSLAKLLTLSLINFLNIRKKKNRKESFNNLKIEKIILCYIIHDIKFFKDMLIVVIFFNLWPMTFKAGINYFSSMPIQGEIRLFMFIKIWFLINYCYLINLRSKTFQVSLLKD